MPTVRIGRISARELKADMTIGEVGLVQNLESLQEN